MNLKEHSDRALSFFFTEALGWYPKISTASPKVESDAAPALMAEGEAAQDESLTNVIVAEICQRSDFPKSEWLCRTLK